MGLAALVTVAALFTVAALPDTSEAAFTQDAIRCRTGFGKRAERFAKTLEKIIYKCHQARREGKIPASVDCTDMDQDGQDVVYIDVVRRIEKGESLLRGIPGRKCGGVFPDQLGMESCPVNIPQHCPVLEDRYDNLDIVTTDDLYKCFICMVLDAVPTMMQASLGDPAIGICQGGAHDGLACYSCVGGSEAGSPCNDDSDCDGGGSCTAGGADGNACTADADCSGGSCRRGVCEVPCGADGSCASDLCVGGADDGSTCTNSSDCQADPMTGAEGSCEPVFDKRSEGKCHHAIAKAQSSYIRTLMKQRGMCRKADEEAGGVNPTPWCQTGHCVDHSQKCGPPNYAAECALTIDGDADKETSWNCTERRCYPACKRDSDCGDGTCIKGACRTLCDDDNPCQTGETCVDNSAVRADRIQGVYDKSAAKIRTNCAAKKLDAAALASLDSCNAANWDDQGAYVDDLVDCVLSAATARGDGLFTDFYLPIACGDGNAQEGEECDDGPYNIDNTDGCNRRCAASRCGDGYSTVDRECSHCSNDADKDCFKDGKREDYVCGYCYDPSCPRKGKCEKASAAGGCGSYWIGYKSFSDKVKLCVVGDADKLNEECRSSTDCGEGGSCKAGTCDGGTNAGSYCNDDDICQGSNGSCQPSGNENFCVGGDQAGAACTDDNDCTGDHGSCGLFVDGVDVTRYCLWDDDNATVSLCDGGVYDGRCDGSAGDAGRTCTGGLNNGHICETDDDCPGYVCNPDRDCCETDRHGRCKLHKVPDDNGIMVIGHGECDNVGADGTGTCKNGAHNTEACDTSIDCAGGGSCEDVTVDVACEECDTSDLYNSNEPNMCRDNCLLPYCGDGIVDSKFNEICDDGNRNNEDDCNNNCKPAGCGNGVLSPLEECDDGNLVNTDSCTNMCTVNRCGDGVVCADTVSCGTVPGTRLEACDDGNEKDYDGCSFNCLQKETCIESAVACNPNNANGCMDETSPSTGQAFGVPYPCVNQGDGTGECAVYQACPINQEAVGIGDCRCGEGDANADLAADRNYAYANDRNCQSNAQCPQGECVSGKCRNCIDVDECVATLASQTNACGPCIEGEADCTSPDCTMRDGSPDGRCIDTNNDGAADACSLGLQGDRCEGNGECVGECRDYDGNGTKTCYTCGDDNPPSWRDGSGSGGECVNLTGSYSCAVDSDEGGFEGALPSCGYQNFYGDQAITFHCDPDLANEDNDCLPQTIYLYDPPIDTTGVNPSQMWGSENVRKTLCNGMLIDGTNRGITIEMSDSDTQLLHEHEEGACKAFAESLGGSYVTSHGCTEVEDGAGFLRLKGNNNTIRNLTVKHFFEGVQITGSFNTIEDMTFDGLCDDALTSGFKTDAGRGIGNRVISSVFKNGCDKCTQFYGGDLASLSPTGAGSITCPAPIEWSAEYDGVQWVDCAKPMRATAGGRVMVKNSVVTTSGESDHGGCLVSALSGGSSEFEQGLSSGPFAIYFENTKIAGCTIGLQLGGAVNAVLRDTTISSNEQVGILLRKDSQLVLRSGNKIIFNGGQNPPSSKQGYGGIAVNPTSGSYNPVTALGGASIMLPAFPSENVPNIPGKEYEASSDLKNRLCDNRNHTNDPKDLQVDNQYSGPPIMAQGVDWCGKTPAVAGPVIVD